MAEAVKVIVRCRPMNGRENGLKCKNAVKIDTRLAQCAIRNLSDAKAPPKNFTFDGAYGEDSTTEQIYADIGYPLVEGVTEGYNGTIFAYGQTGCGKSFSMQGITDPATQRGIIPRAFDHIFETIQVSEGVKYLVHASYLEIYNEETRDLLGVDTKKRLDLKEHPERGVYVQDLSMHLVKNVRECERVMEKGWKNRATGSTAMNAESSRSHSIFSIRLERCDTDESTGEDHIRAAKLNLVDLAGSERQAKTGSTGDRLKEATKINLSLSALGNVISALVDGKSKHIPYRDSKLTRLLQDSLGGNTKTLMVACLSPADNNYDESLSTLRYANRAKNIKNKPKINEDPKDALLREYHDEIQKLKAMLRGEIPVSIDDGSSHGVITMGASHQPGAPETRVVEKIVTVTNEEELEVERERIRDEYEREMSKIRDDYEEMKMSKEKLQEEMTRLRDNYDTELASVDSAVHIQSPGQVSQSASVNGFEEQAQPKQRRVPKADGQQSSATSADEEDAEYLQPEESQHAVHLSTMSVNEGGLVAPRSSPTGDPKTGNPKYEEALRRESVVNNEAEALQRLQELQQQMVGGEEASNEVVKQRRIKRKKYAEERKKKLQEALANMDGEDIMLNIYDNVSDELKARNKLLQKEKDVTDSLQTEIADLQSEFEFDRIDYLDTIRKQEQQMKWLQSVVDKVHPCLRRDCNYVNLDRIKAHSVWDEDNQCWNLPKMTIEKNKLPPAGVHPGARQEPTYTKGAEVQASIYDDLQSEDRYLEKLSRSNEQELANNYFKSKRTGKLLNKTREDRQRGGGSPSDSFTNGLVTHPTSQTSSAAWQQTDSLTQDQLRAAQVHGQISPDDFPVRKPTRLESLAPSGAKSARRKKNKQTNVMEQW